MDFGVVFILILDYEFWTDFHPKAGAKRSNIVVQHLLVQQC